MPDRGRRHCGEVHRSGVNVHSSHADVSHENWRLSRYLNVASHAAPSSSASSLLHLQWQSSTEAWRDGTPLLGGSASTLLRCAEVNDPTASWVSEELPGALAQALARVGRAGVPVTVRIHSVILGPSSGGQGPNNASQLTEYACALAKAGHYQEALDLLDLIDNLNTPRALTYRGPSGPPSPPPPHPHPPPPPHPPTPLNRYATSKLGRDGGGDRLLPKIRRPRPANPQVRAYLGRGDACVHALRLIEGGLDDRRKALRCGGERCASVGLLERSGDKPDNSP